MRAVASHAWRCQLHMPCRSASRSFAAAAGGTPNKLPPELEKMLKASGITLPPGARVEIKEISGTDFSDLPPFIRNMSRKKRTPLKETKSEKLPDVIALPPAENSTTEPSIGAKNPSAGRKLGKRRKAGREGARNKPPQSLLDLFAGNGVKSFVLNAPEGVKTQPHETNPDFGLEARDWYQKQLSGGSADNPIDVNYFDRAVYSDFNFAIAPAALRASDFSLDLPWPVGAAMPSKAHLDLDTAGKLTRILISCDASDFSADVPFQQGGGETVRVDYCQGQWPVPETDTDTTVVFTPSVGHFFSSAGATLGKTVMANDQAGCSVCSAAIEASAEAFTTTPEDDEPFLVCVDCVEKARALRERGYSALAGTPPETLHTKDDSKVSNIHKMNIGRLLGAPTKPLPPLEGQGEDEATPNILTGAVPSRTFRIEKNVDVRFADVLGQEIAVEKLREFVDILRFPDSYGLVGSKVPKGGLLTGPPGTGKTLLAQAVAGECQLPFISVQGSEFNESLVGSGPRNVRKLFKTARKQAALSGGCIVFIDEIDSIGRSRSRSDNSSASQGYCDTLNQLLAEIDGFHSKTDQIVLLAATNRANVLDKALLRAGRFDRLIPMERPNIKEREALFWHYLQSLAWRDGSVISDDDVELALNTADLLSNKESLTNGACQLRKLNLQSPRSSAMLVEQLDELIGKFVRPRLDLCLTRKDGVTDILVLRTRKRSILKIGLKYYVANDDDLSSVSVATAEAIGKIAKTAARMTTGLTGATISSICNEAGIMAVREQIHKDSIVNNLIVTSVASHHIAKAIDFVAAGSEKKNFRMSLEEKSAVAYHESGHTVAASLLNHHPDPVKVTIVPRDSGSLGFMMPGEPLSEVRQSKEQIEAQICVLMGGRISEEIFCNDVAAGAKEDIERVTALARQYVSAYGMGAGNAFCNTTDDRWFSEATKAKRDERMFALIDECYEKTKRLLLEHRLKVQALQGELLQKETLFADEINAILK